MSYGMTGMTAKGQEKPLQRQEKWWPKGHQRHLAGIHQHTGSTVCKEPDRTSPGYPVFMSKIGPRSLTRDPGCTARLCGFQPCSVTAA